MEGCTSGRNSWPDTFSSFYQHVLLPAAFSIGKMSPQGRGQGPHSPAGGSWWGTKHKPSRIVLEETVMVLGALISLNGSYQPHRDLPAHGPVSPVRDQSSVPA